MAQSSKEASGGTKKDAIARRENANKKRANAYKALHDAFIVAQKNGYKGLQNLNEKRPKQVLHTKGDVDKALFKVDNETYKSEIAEPLKEAAEDIKAMEYSEKVKEALQNFIDLKAGGGGKSTKPVGFSTDF